MTKLLRQFYHYYKIHPQSEKTCSNKNFIHQFIPIYTIYSTKVENL